MPAISATWPPGAVMTPLLMTLGAAMSASPWLPTVMAAPGAIVTSPAPGASVVSRIELVAKFVVFRSPIPPLRNRALLVARSFAE